MDSPRKPVHTLDLLMISNFGAADGGRETWAYNFIPRLLRRWPDLRLRVLGLRRDGEPDNRDNLLALGPADGRFEVSFVPSSRRRFVALSMFDAARKKHGRGRDAPPQLVLAVGSAVELVAVLIAPAYRNVVKFVWLRNIMWDEKGHQIPGWLQRFARAAEIRLLRRADAIIANGEDTAAYYQRSGLAVTVIANAIDFDKWFHPVEPPREALKIAFIGRLNTQKGAPEFLELASRLRGDPRFEFHAIGAGPFSERFEEAARSGDLTYHGPLRNSELPARLAEYDVCVALTIHSDRHGGAGLSNALLEQMAAGRVIVAWDNVIFRQLLSDENAFLVPQSDVDALDSALRRIAAEPQLAALRARAGQDIARRHSIEDHVDKFVTLAKSAVGAAWDGAPDE